jgi:predicted AlkP superfamily pyrophosphatase or phosphodiesterase
VPLSPAGSVGTLALRKKDNDRGWRATPEFDQMALDVGLAGLKEMKLGQGATTDVFAISFSATDYTGHSFGTSGAEMCAQIFALDALLGKLFTTLDKTGVDYVVVLTGDHGGHDLPERNKTSGLPSAERVDSKLSAVAMGKVLAAQFGLDGSALIGRATFGDMYLAPNVPKEKRLAVRDAAVAAYRAHPQVAAVFTRDDLLNAPAPSGPVDEWSLMSRAKASFDPERSGDFLVLLNPYITPIPDTSVGYVATHGSPWGYDRRVPILFWWKNIAPFEQPNAVETVDILPTLASLIGLPIPPAEIDGRCLDIIVGPASNCP